MIFVPNIPRYLPKPDSRNSFGVPILAIHNTPITIGSEIDIISRYMAIQNILCLIVSSKHRNAIIEISTVVVIRFRTILSLNKTIAERMLVNKKKRRIKNLFLIFRLQSKEK